MALTRTPHQRPVSPGRVLRRGGVRRTAIAAVVLAISALVGFAASASAIQPLAGSALPAAVVPAETPTASSDVELILFWGDGCPKCEAERTWLDEIGPENPTLTITQHEVWYDKAGRDLFQETAANLGFEASSVPTTIIGERVWIGWTDEIRDDIAKNLQRAIAGEDLGSGMYGQHGEGTCSEADAECVIGDDGTIIDVPLFGKLNVSNQNLIVSTLAIGFVDGINPCSLWAISVLLAIVIRTQSRTRVVAIGSTFLLVTAAMYALFMVGIYSALTVVGFLGWIQWLVAIVAMVVGAFSVKDYFAFKQGPSLTISDSAKPGIYKRMRAAAGHKKLLPAIAATTGLAVAVSLLETPCTAGFPVIWTGLLKANGVGHAEAAALFVLYMIPFLLDEFIVFAIAVITMRATKMQEKHGRLLKLVAGVTMLALAAVMIVDPALMESPLWALVIFVGAILLAIAIHLVTVRVKERQGEAFIEAQSPDVAADAAQVSAGGAPPGDDPDATHAPPAP